MGFNSAFKGLMSLRNGKTCDEKEELNMLMFYVATLV